MACVWVGMDVSELFLVNVRLRQGCVRSPWLFNVYVYGWCGARGECRGAWEVNAVLWWSVYDKLAVIRR